MLSTKNVTVVCKLPHGFEITVGNTSRKLNGANTDPAVKSPIAVVLNSEAHGTTSVPEDFMAAWMKRNAKHPAVVNGAIRIVKENDKASVRAASKDAGKTGLEAMKKDAGGVKPEDGK